MIAHSFSLLWYIINGKLADLLTLILQVLYFIFPFDFCLLIHSSLHQKTLLHVTASHLTHSSLQRPANQPLLFLNQPSKETGKNLFVYLSSLLSSFLSSFISSFLSSFISSFLSSFLLSSFLLFSFLFSSFALFYSLILLSPLFPSKPSNSSLLPCLSTLLPLLSSFPSLYY